VSIRPDRIWSIGLFKGTVTHENFSQTGCGALQLLAPKHAALVKLLGSSSGRDVDKKVGCQKLSFPWGSAPQSLLTSSTTDLPELLPDCVIYLHLSLVKGGLLDCGSHDMAMCKAETMFGSSAGSGKEPYLNTALLREMGIITKLGRVAED
jgi:flavin reductase (DIM6/NTAB) family NADH-FMN oxidoreductase RutF